MNTTRIFGALALLAALAACDRPATVEEAPIAFADQAAAGEASYATWCAACHGAQMQGSALGPVLSGAGFMGRYG